MEIVDRGWGMMKQYDAMRDVLVQCGATMVYNVRMDGKWWFAIGRGDFVPFRTNDNCVDFENFVKDAKVAVTMYEHDISAGDVYTRTEFDECERAKAAVAVKE